MSGKKKLRIAPPSAAMERMRRDQAEIAAHRRSVDTARSQMASIVRESERMRWVTPSEKDTLQRLARELRAVRIPDNRAKAERASGKAAELVRQANETLESARLRERCADRLSRARKRIETLTSQASLVRAREDIARQLDALEGGIPKLEQAGKSSDQWRHRFNVLGAQIDSYEEAASWLERAGRFLDRVAQQDWARPEDVKAWRDALQDTAQHDTEKLEEDVRDLLRRVEQSYAQVAAEWAAQECDRATNAARARQELASEMTAQETVLFADQNLELLTEQVLATSSGLNEARRRLAADDAEGARTIVEQIRHTVDELPKLAEAARRGREESRVHRDNLVADLYGRLNALALPPGQASPLGERISLLRDLDERHVARAASAIEQEIERLRVVSAANRQLRLLVETLKSSPVTWDESSKKALEMLVPGLSVTLSGMVASNSFELTIKVNDDGSVEAEKDDGQQAACCEAMDAVDRLLKQAFGNEAVDYWEEDGRPRKVPTSPVAQEEAEEEEETEEAQERAKQLE